MNNPVSGMNNFKRGFEQGDDGTGPLPNAGHGPILVFVYALREAGIPVSIRYVVDFLDALRRGLAPDLDRLFLLSRLIFIKRVEHYDMFEKVFAACFTGEWGEKNLLALQAIFAAKPFEKWLQEAILSGRLSLDTIREFDPEGLLARFFETMLAQEGEHHGGATWVGTRGHSPFGHGGRRGGGIRIHGEGLHGTAQKIIGERRHVDYSEGTQLSAENLRQALSALKGLRPIGPETELDTDETINRTARNGGEIELVFRREKHNRVQLIILMDNGGYSMIPHIDLVRTVFSKIRDAFNDVNYYYFHNCIYGTVFHDPQRRRPLMWEKLLSRSRRNRLVIIGDANMAPAELMMSAGSLDVFTLERKPGREWLSELRTAFPASVWLNPIPRNLWDYRSRTIHEIGQIFHMEDLSLAGIRRAVEVLNLHGQVQDHL